MRQATPRLVMIGQNLMSWYDSLKVLQVPVLWRRQADAHLELVPLRHRSRRLAWTS